MENKRPGRRSCRETRSGWKIGRVEGVVEENYIWMENRRPPRRSCRETRSGWQIGGLIGVVTRRIDLDEKWDA